MLAAHTTPQNHKGRCIRLIQRPQTWCGEGDLNPQRLLKTRKLLKPRCDKYDQNDRMHPFWYVSGTREPFDSAAFLTAYNLNWPPSSTGRQAGDPTRLAALTEKREIARKGEAMSKRPHRKPADPDPIFNDDVRQRVLAAYAEDPSDLLDGAARGRIDDAFEKAALIQTRAVVEAETKHRNDPQQTAIVLAEGNMAAAREVLPVIMAQYQGAGKSGIELAQIMQEVIDGLELSLELTSNQRYLLRQELRLYREPKVCRTVLACDIDKYRKECRWSLNTLARETGIDKKLILGHVNKGKGMQMDTVKAYERAFTKKLNRPITLVVPES